MILCNILDSFQLFASKITSTDNAGFILLAINGKGRFINSSPAAELEQCMPYYKWEATEVVQHCPIELPESCVENL